MKQKTVVYGLCIILVTLLMQGCTSKGLLTESHSDLSHVDDGLAIVTVRLAGPYVLKSITLRNIDTGTRYGETYIFNPPADIAPASNFGNGYARCASMLTASLLVTGS